MVTEAHRAKTARHFGHLAKTYDQRWQRYLHLTLSRAVGALRMTGPARVLDVGCGTGEFEQLAHQRFPEARLVGIDVTPDMLAVARGKFQDAAWVTFLLAQAEDLPVASERFDAVVSCSMLHHVEEPEKLLRECARALRPGGQLVVVDWCRDFLHERVRHYWLRLVKPSYAKMYCGSELVEFLHPLGFVVQDVQRFFVWPYFGMMRLSATKGPDPTR